MPNTPSPSESHTRRSLFDYTAPTEDTPEALNLDGYDDEEAATSEIRIAQAQTGAGFVPSVRNFYGNYWVVRGTASSSELAWGLTWALSSTLIFCALTGWMGFVVEAGGDSVSSLFRVLYMLMAYVTPAWVLVHIGPTASLVRRFINARGSR